MHQTQTIKKIYKTLILVLLAVLPLTSLTGKDHKKIQNLLNRAKDLKESNADSALYYGKKSLSLARSEYLHELEVKVIIELSDIYYFKNEREKAFNLLTDALEICNKKNLQQDKIEVLYNLGLHYSRSGRKGNEVIDEEKIFKGLEYYAKAIEIAKELELPELISKGYNLSAVNFQRLEDFDKSLEYFRLSESYSRAANDSIGLGYTLDYSASLLTSMEKFNEAEDLLLEALQIREALGDSFPYAINLNNLGEFYYSQEKFNEAAPYLEQSFEISESKDYKDLGLHTAGILSSIYDQFKDYEKAYHLKVKEQRMRDSLFNERRMKTLEDLEVKYESEVKEKELLKTKKIAAENDLKAVKRLNYIYYLAGGSIVLILLSLGVVQSIRRKEKDKRNQLRLQEKEKATKSIILAQEEERRKIARELHDGIGQQIGGLKLALHSESQEKLAKIIDSTAEEVRGLSHQMMPKTLMKVGLKEALEDLFDKTLILNNIHYEFESFGIQDRLSEDVEVSFFRVAQELTNNVIKHSKAKNVTIQLMKNKNHLIMRFEDDGKGFSKSHSDGIGLTNIETRLNTIGASMSVESSPNQGATFIIKKDV